MRFIALFDPSELASAVSDAVRVVFFTLDRLIYWIVAILYKLFYYVSTSRIIADTATQGIYKRIGYIIGIYMVFVLMFSFIKMLLNPEELSDNKKGARGIITKVIISIILLGTINTIFDEAYDLQYIIVKENIIGKMITGRASSSHPSDSSIGIEFSKNIFFSFFKDKESPFVYEAPIGGVTYCYDEPTQEEIANGVYCNDENILTKMVNNKQYLTPLTPFANLTKNSFEYVIEYTYLISTIVGCFVGYILINYIFDVAIRIVQLFYLQMIAPIPILSYILPKGEEKLNVWGKQCFVTYADLFIRILFINLSFYLIELLNSDVFIKIKATATSGTQAAVKLMVLIGVLMFAKKAPELLKEIFPMNWGAAKGNFKLGKEGSASKPLRALAGAGAGISGAIGGGISGWKEGGLLGAIGGAVKGGVGGTVSGAMAGAKQEKLSAIYGKQAGINKQKMANANKGSTPWGRLATRTADLLGVPDAATATENRNAQIDKKIAEADKEIAAIDRTIEPIKRRKDIMDQVASNIGDIKTRSTEQIDAVDISTLTNATRDRSKTREQRLAHYRAYQDVFVYRQAQANYQAALQGGDATAIADATTTLATAKNTAIQSYTDAALKDDTLDSAITSKKNNLQNIQSVHSSELAADSVVLDSGGNITADSLKDAKSKATNSSITATREIYNEEQKKLPHIDEKTRLTEQKRVNTENAENAKADREAVDQSKK